MLSLLIKHRRRLSFRMPGAIFFPEHHQVDPGTLEFANQLALDWFGTPAHPTRGTGAGKQPLLQNRIGQVCRQRPSQSRHLRSLHVVLDRAACHAQHSPNLPGADPLTSQPQCISYLPHRQLSLRRHPPPLVVDHERANARVTDPADNARGPGPTGRN